MVPLHYHLCYSASVCLAFVFIFHCLWKNICTSFFISCTVSKVVCWLFLCHSHNSVLSRVNVKLVLLSLCALCVSILSKCSFTMLRLYLT